MRRNIALFLVLLMTLSVLTACNSSGTGSQPAETTAAAETTTAETAAADGAEESAAADAGAADTFDPAKASTMGDVFAYVGENSQQEGYTETHYVIAFEAEGVTYRAIAELPEDVSKALWEIDFEDEDKDQKTKDLVSPLEAKIENLTEQIPSQEELDKYIGKTGQELFDEGWSEWYYNLEEMEAGMYYGLFDYAVRFEYDGEPMVNSDDFDFQENFKDLKVSSVTYQGLGTATDVE